jgi:PAS domain S-box-containing protein
MSHPNCDVLLIEDSEADRVLIGAMLAERPANGFQIVARESLEAGLAWLHQGEAVVAVLLDLSLPDSHGLETFRAVRQAAPQLPIVILTGNDDEHAALEAMQLGAQDYLFKNSLTGELLQKSLRYAIERKRLECSWREELEQRVRERTAELSAVNEQMRREIVERRRVEEALRESQRFVERITDAAPSIIYILDIVSRRLIYANNRLRSILGYELDEVQNWSNDFLERIVHRDDQSRVHSELAGLDTIGDDETREVELRIRHADGHWRWMSFRTVVFRRDANGSVRLVLGSVTDISARKETEEQARQQQEQLVHFSRLTMLGELSTGIAHELNQPLMAVANYTQAALRRLRSGNWSLEQVTGCLEKSVQQALLAGEIIKRLRRLVSRRSPEKSPTDLIEAIHEVVEMLHSEAERAQIQLRIQSSDRLPPVNGDRVQLQQVLLNLVRNGLEAMRDAPADQRLLTVDTRRIDRENIVVSVIDQGSGCDIQELDRLFEPFFTTKAQGLGLGLSISRSIIESHGGQLTVRPNPTRGLTFQFTLPIHVEVAS